MTPLTESQAAALLAARLGGSVNAATRARNPHLWPAEDAETVAGSVAPAGKRLRQSRDKLNVLETEALALVRSRYPGARIRSQDRRYKIGGHWYKPDITGTGGGLEHETVWEVKGPHAFRGGFENLKDLAALWPELRCFLIWKDQITKEWREQAMESFQQENNND